MSRIGKAIIQLPANVKFSVSPANVVTVSGPKGELQRTIDPAITFEQEGNTVIVKRATDNKRHRSIHGLYRTLVNNMVIGVSQGFTIEQELVGVGYRAEAKGNLLDLTLGYSHNYVIVLPAEVSAETITEKGKNPRIILKSNDKQLLGQVAAKIRSLRKPEPYKGKGIRFMGEVLRRKAGKSAGK